MPHLFCNMLLGLLDPGAHPQQILELWGQEKTLMMMMMMMVMIVMMVMAVFANLSPARRPC